MTFGGLPNDLQNIILDYYWSHKNYILKRRLHQDFRERILMIELDGFLRYMPANLRLFLIGE